MTKKKIQKLYKAALIIGLPVSLYIFVYSTNIERPQVASATTSTAPLSPLPDATAKPVTLTQNTKPAPAVKKPTTTAKKTTTATKKKTPVKKKAPVKKEKLIAVPALITAETAPHTAR